MKKFWLVLETELRAQRISVRDSIVGNDEKLVICRRIPSGQIYAQYLEIYPAKDRAHHLEIDEIWVGRWPKEGSGWSDNMGGLRIDFTGKSMKAAAQELVKVLLEHFPDYFSRHA